MANDWIEYKKAAKAKGFTPIACVSILGWWPATIETMQSRTYIATYLGRFI